MTQFERMRAAQMRLLEVAIRWDAEGDCWDVANGLCKHPSVHLRNLAEAATVYARELRAFCRMRTDYIQVGNVQFRFEYEPERPMTLEEARLIESALARNEGNGVILAKYGPELAWNCVGASALHPLPEPERPITPGVLVDAEA